jgi:hypothetical protein
MDEKFQALEKFPVKLSNPWKNGQWQFQASET